MSGQGHRGAEGAEVLADLPDPLWGALLRAVRRTADQVEDAELPAGLRPFARFKPGRMTTGRARQAVIGALAGDEGFRFAVGEALDEAVHQAGAQADPLRLAAEHGEELAVASLVVHARWDAVAVLSAAAAERVAARQRSAAEQSARQEAARVEHLRNRLSQELEVAREERDAARRQLDAAVQARQRAEEALPVLQEQVDHLRLQVRELEAAAAKERDRDERRLARLRRELAAAEAAAKVDRARVQAVLDDLERLTGDLRGALDVSGAWSGQVEGMPRPPVTAPVPRDVPPAEPGRPCRLPPGVSPDTPAAVRALLQVPDLEVLVDGYNVSLDPAGQQRAALPDQRRWLEQLAAGVVGRFQRRVVVVFDGRDHVAEPRSGPRGVVVLFTADAETADDRIVSLLEAHPQRSALVVSSDRELTGRCAAVGADVVSAGTFLRALA